MDLRLYARVLWRFRYLLVFGALLAVLFSLLSYNRISLSLSEGFTVTPRKPQLWESTESLLLTQPGFPPGRSIFQNPTFADPNRFVSLAAIYARLASSDEVKQVIEKGGVLPGRFFAAQDYGRGDVPLPTITTYGQALSAEAAKTVASRGTNAFIRYIQREQNAARIPESQRVALEVLGTASEPRVVVARTKTLPIVVLLAVLSATIALAFVLENLRPQPSPDEARVRVPEVRPESRPEPVRVPEPRIGQLVTEARSDPVAVPAPHAEPVVVRDEPEEVSEVPVALPEKRRWA